MQTQTYWNSGHKPNTITSQTPNTVTNIIISLTVSDLVYWGLSCVSSRSPSWASVPMRYLL